MQSLRTGSVTCLAFALSLGLAAASAGESVAESNNQEQVQANPIRKVVDMLQMMQKRVEKEGAKEKELYDKFMCWCKSDGEALSKAISAANTKIPELNSMIAELEALLAKLKADVDQHNKDRDAAKAAIAEATEIREKEAAAAKKDSVNNQVYILALKKAIAALEKGTYGAFLQTKGAAMLKTLLQSDSRQVNLIDADREDLMAFLNAPAYGNEYVPQGQEIIGILKQLMDEMVAAEKDGTAGEAKAVADFKLLVKAKLAEIDALNKLIEDKLTRIGETSVKISMYKNDLGDTEEALAGDTKFLTDLKRDCSKKTAEYEERCKMRSMELAAIADTIKVLNDDDALDLFKKTLPSASLLQVASNMAQIRQRALKKIRALRFPDGRSRPQLDLIVLALNGEKIGFAKIISMIDDMLATLAKEQVDDDTKLEYCKTQLDETDDKKKVLERTISNLESEISSLQDSLATVTAEIDALEDGIKALDKSVAEATEQRKDEHEAFVELMSSDGAAKELLEYAKNRMHKFYNPKLHKPAPKTVLLQVVEHEDPPKTWEGGYKKQDEGGVLAMMDTLIKDVTKEMTEASAQEENTQEAYETFMKDSSTKRSEDSKDITDKTMAKAQMEDELESRKESKASAGNSLAGTVEYLHALHTECDWTMKYYDVRKEARADETSALQNAKAVLSGADFSFLQEQTGPKASSLRGQQ